MEIDGRRSAWYNRRFREYTIGLAGLAVKVHGLKPVVPVIEIAVTSSTSSEPSHADDLRTAAEHVLRGNYHMDNEAHVMRGVAYAFSGGDETASGRSGGSAQFRRRSVLWRKDPGCKAAMGESLRVADVQMTSDWQQRLAAIGRYNGPVDGNCDRELIDVFTACARDRCQF